MSFKKRFILIISSVLIVTGCLIIGIIYWQNNRILTEHVKTDVRWKINQSFQLIDIYIDQVKNNLTNLANDPLVIKALETQDPLIFVDISQKMTIIHENIDIIENLSLMEVKDLSCFPRAANKEAQSALGKDFSNRDYCQGVIETQDTYLSSAYISTISKQPVLGLVVPVKNVEGKMLGFVYGSINLDKLRGYLWDLQENSKVELLDRDGIMFLNTEEKIKTLNDLPQEEIAELNIINSKINNKVYEEIFQDEDNFVGYKFNGSLTVIFEETVVSLLSLSKTLNLTIIFSLIIAILLIIIIINLLIRSITKRISDLNDVAKMIEGGKLDIKIREADLKGGDEITSLARAFGKMTLKLKDIYDNLDQKVKERTKKLEKSELALRNNLDESERVNKLMIGRELEMIKLKKELREFKNK